MEKEELIIDARGQACPYPVLLARAALKSLQAGETIRVLATDAMASVDIPAFCARTGNQLLEESTAGGIYCFVIRKTV